MADQGVRHTIHEITVDAPAQQVYPLIADVTRWPYVFPPTVHAEQVESDGTAERIHIWATANGEVKHWMSRRVLDPGALRVEFRQEVSQHPVAAMGGAWVIKAIGDRQCLVTLEHDFRAVDDDPAHVTWILQAIDRNSAAELGALRVAAEGAGEESELYLHFDDTVEVDGAAGDLYDFINEAGQWPDRLPHVASVEFSETAAGVQTLGMLTRAPDGSTHETRSVRICFPQHTIVYKQLQVPALMTAHTGAWRVTSTPTGSTVTSAHTVVLNPANVAAVLGPAATVADARVFVHKALLTNSATTMRHAKQYAEQRNAGETS
jgi:aromatase